MGLTSRAHAAGQRPGGAASAWRVCPDERAIGAANRGPTGARGGGIRARMDQSRASRFGIGVASSLRREGVRPHPAAGGAVTRAASLAVPVLVLPALVLSLAVVLAVARPHPDWLAATVRVAPLVVFVGGSVLGFFLRRGRFVLGLVVLAMADRALAHFS